MGFQVASMAAHKAQPSSCSWFLAQYECTDLCREPSELEFAPRTVEGAHSRRAHSPYCLEHGCGALERPCAHHEI